MDEEEALLYNRACTSPETGEAQVAHWSGEFKKAWRRDYCPCVPARYTLAIMSFLGFVVLYALRVNLSMVIVVMVNNSANGSTNNQFNWTSTEQGWILSAFFYGYIITQIPGGLLAARYGGKTVLGLGIVVTAVLTLLTPLAARINFGVLIGLRILEGLFEGVTFPTMHAMWGKWAPPAERSTLVTITYAGPIVGNVVSFPLSAVLCVYGFDGGWPSVFYTFGFLGIIWYIFWLLLIFDSPANHPHISKAERDYIESGIPDADKMVPVPWFQIFTSRAVWAVIVCFICYGWGGYIMLTCIPSYLHDTLGLSLGNNLIENGIFSSIPYIGYAVVTIVCGRVADLLRKCISTKNVRKGMTISEIPMLSQSVGKLTSDNQAFVFGAAGLLITGHLAKNKLDSVLYLSLTVGGSALIQAGFMINHIDLAPRFAGVLMGITNTFGTLPGIVAPVVAKYIAQKPPDGSDVRHIYQEEWRKVFLIAAEVYLFGAVVYLILADGKKQWWADGVKKDRKHHSIQ